MQTSGPRSALAEQRKCPPLPCVLPHYSPQVRIPEPKRTLAGQAILSIRSIPRTWKTSLTILMPICISFMMDFFSHGWCPTHPVRHREADRSEGGLSIAWGPKVVCGQFGKLMFRADFLPESGKRHIAVKTEVVLFVR